MKTEKPEFTLMVLQNVRNIMNDKKLKQSTVADFIGVSESQISKILNGNTMLSIEQLSKFSRAVKMPVIDVITYPDKYVQLVTNEQEPVEAILQIKLRKEKKEQVLKLVFGENNIEILNK